jgi:dipeptidyl aminopeptidase/acylaminoacyl peptidase
MRCISRSAWLLSFSAAALAGCASDLARTPALTAEKGTGATTQRHSAAAFYDTTIYRLTGSTSHSFSTDGRSVLIGTDRTGVFNAYALPIDGKAPLPLTTSTKHAAIPVSYFPGDDRMLFIADEGGNELTHLYVRERDGSIRDVTPGPKLKAGFLGWSGNGKRLFITSNERDPTVFDLYSIDATTYEKRLLFKNEDFAIDGVSPDGRYVSLMKRDTRRNSNLYLADLHSGTAPKPIIPHKEALHLFLSFTPDGKSLVYSTDEYGEFGQAWIYDVANGATRPLIKADWDVLSVTHSPSGRYRVSYVNDEEAIRVSIRDRQANDKEVALRHLPKGEIGSVRFNQREDAIAFTVTSDTSPSNIFVADLGTGVVRQLTRSLSPPLQEADLVEGVIARFESYDGLQVPGVLYRPKAASASNPVPALVLVHGGPGDQSRKGGDFALVQHLVNNGYAVYKINHRGSKGYGKTFYNLDNRRHGEADLGDIVASKPFLQSYDWIADDKIGILGGSFGGFLTAAALAFHPTVFDAGVNLFGITNWVRTLGSMPPWWAATVRKPLIDEMGDPATDMDRHRRMSPLFSAGKIVKPMLVLQGANDPRVLKAESDDLVAAIKANGVPVEYVLFPDEGHGFVRRENNVAASEAIVRFLDTYLKARK